MYFPFHHSSNQDFEDDSDADSDTGAPPRSGLVDTITDNAAATIPVAVARQNRECSFIVEAPADCVG
jgi:hypothetical protein